ncbi:MAG: hypothetical protein ACXVAX_00960 [Pseudobdellovibrio sp.]
MNSQQLLLINFLIIGALVLYFVLGRSKHKQKAILDVKQESQSFEEVKVEKTEQGESIVSAVVEIKEETKKVSSKEIVFFVYNGHEWEAHEVLGLKSGVSLEEATRHYQNLIKTSDPSTFEFFEAAFSAILRLKSSKW